MEGIKLNKGLAIVKKNSAILLLALGLSNCSLLNPPPTHQMQPDYSEPAAAIGDYMVKYTSQPDLNRTHRMHPPASNYIILSIDIKGIKIPEKIGDITDLIPYVLTLNDGYVWGDIGYFGDILGCCEFKDVNKGIQYVLESSEIDSLRKIYEEISSSVKIELFDSVYSKYSYVKRNELIEMSVCKIQGVYCKCPFYQSESKNFSFANDTLIYIKRLTQVNSLNDQERQYFKELFETINGM